MGASRAVIDIVDVPDDPNTPENEEIVSNVRVIDGVAHVTLNLANVGKPYTSDAGIIGSGPSNIDWPKTT